MKYFIYIMATLFCPMIVFCQDITGLWKGTMINDSTKQSLQYEVVISKDNGKYTGFSQTWFLINEKKYYGVKKINVRVAKDGKIIMQDAAMIDNNYPILRDKDVFQLNVLDLANHGDETILDGLFVTNRTKDHNDLTGHINIKRVSAVSSPISKIDLLQYLQKDSRGNNLTVVK